MNIYAFCNIINISVNASKDKDSGDDNKIYFLIISTIIGILASLSTTYLLELMRRNQKRYEDLSKIIDDLELKKNDFIKKVKYKNYGYDIEKLLLKRGLLGELKRIITTQYEDKENAEKEISGLIDRLENLKRKQLKLKK
jgi:hypothetical protein